VWGPGGVVGSHGCDEWRGNKEKERRRRRNGKERNTRLELRDWGLIGTTNSAKNPLSIVDDYLLN
jgi:hypothetical protein